MIKKSLQELAGQFIKNGTKFNYTESMENLKQLQKVETNAYGGYTLYYITWDSITETVNHRTAEVAEDRGIYIPTYEELEEWYENKRRARQQHYSAMRMYKQMQETKKKPVPVRDEAKHEIASKRRRTAARLAKGREIIAAYCGHL